jgi:hypothetical protein
MASALFSQDSQISAIQTKNTQWGLLRSRSQAKFVDILTALKKSFETAERPAAESRRFE